MMKRYYVDMAVHCSLEKTRSELESIPFEPYTPVRRQVLNIPRVMSRARKKAGFELVPMEAVRLRRRILKPFVGERDQTLEIERSADVSGLKGSEFSGELREYRRTEQDHRPIRRGIQR